MTSWCTTLWDVQLTVSVSGHVTQVYLHTPVHTCIHVFIIEPHVNYNRMPDSARVAFSVCYIRVIK